MIAAFESKRLLKGIDGIMNACSFNGEKVDDDVRVSLESDAKHG